MTPPTLPFWIRRRFVELPDEEFDALHEAAHARAISRLKLAAAVLGVCVAIAYVYWGVAAGQAVSPGDAFKTGAYGVLMGTVAYGMVTVLLVGKVLRCANRSLFLEFAERQTKAAGLRG